MSVCNDKKGSDKFLHALVCFCVAATVGSLLALMLPNKEWSAIIVAFCMAFVAGLWKEVRDSKRNGNHFCVWDLVADVTGAALGCAVVWLTVFLIGLFLK